jgi:hypothetical protein
MLRLLALNLTGMLDIEKAREFLPAIERPIYETTT